MLLPVAVRQQMSFDYAVFAWENYNRTIERMRQYGAKCMAQWFPQGGPQRPVAADFGPSVRD